MLGLKWFHVRKRVPRTSASMILTVLVQQELVIPWGCILTPDNYKILFPPSFWGSYFCQFVQSDKCWNMISLIFIAVSPTQHQEISSSNSLPQEGMLLWRTLRGLQSWCPGFMSSYWIQSKITRGFSLQVLELRMSGRDFIRWQGTNNPSNGYQMT